MHVDHMTVHAQDNFIVYCIAGNINFEGENFCGLIEVSDLRKAKSIVYLNWVGHIIIIPKFHGETFMGGLQTAKFMEVFSFETFLLSGFHLATKIWGGSAINEWAYLARQVPWDVFLGKLL